MTRTNFADRVAGAIFGAAYGDAAGRPTEFIRDHDLSYASVLAYSRRIWENLLGARVTDDTMMMLAVGRAVTSVADGPPDMARTLAGEYVRWADSPQDGRAPGATCMRAVAKLRLSPAAPWQKASQVNSKGCGANMRVQPVAFLRLSPDDASGLAQLSAAITHGHPTALAAADLTAYALRVLAHGHRLDVSLLDTLAVYCRRQRSVYRERWLGNLVAYTDFPAGMCRSWIAQGWDEMEWHVERVRNAVRSGWNDTTDPCLLTGDGWTAGEALATSLLIAIKCDTYGPYGRLTTLTRAALTRGDSDSLGCITGSLIGAAYGMEVWPEHWRNLIEFRSELLALAWGIMCQRQLT